MSILVQREFSVAPEHQAEFERQSREGLWPAFLHFGALMVAFGRWTFGGPTDVLVTHTVYTDFEHWLATRQGEGAYYRDPAMLAEIEALRPVYAERNRLVSRSSARLIEVDDTVEASRPVFRHAGDPMPDPPPTFGRRGVISERTYALREGALPEFQRLSRDYIWPWLQQRGARMVAFGSDPLGRSDEVMTFFAFPSLPDWHRLSRPPAELQPPPEVVSAWQARHALVTRQWGRLLTIATDFGTKV